VLDLDLPDMDGVALLQKIRSDPSSTEIPMVIYTFRVLDHETKERLTQLRAVVLVEGDSSLALLTQEAGQFLHRVQQQLPENKRTMSKKDASSDSSLQGKKVLIADDDVRNLFALTGMLESHGMKVIAVESGKDAIAKLHEIPDIDIVLMDIMMPEMDGFETMRQIRMREEFESLPMIALTAKAMKGDREKCIDAGASDYVSKPVDTDQLLSLMRVWLYR
jgi:hypothetical protein